MSSGDTESKPAESGINDQGNWKKDLSSQVKYETLYKM